MYVTAATFARSNGVVEASNLRQARVPVGVSGASKRTFEDSSSSLLSVVSIVIRFGQKCVFFFSFSFHESLYG